jgi:hypothetical protein
MNQFRLLQAVDRFNQRVVVAACPAVDRQLDACVGRPFAVAHVDVPGTAVGAIDQCSIIARPASVPRRFRCIQNDLFDLFIAPFAEESKPPPNSSGSVS